MCFLRRNPGKIHTVPPDTTQPFFVEKVGEGIGHDNRYNGRQCFGFSGISDGQMIQSTRIIPGRGQECQDVGRGFQGRIVIGTSGNAGLNILPNQVDPPISSSLSQRYTYSPRSGSQLLPINARHKMLMRGADRMMLEPGMPSLRVSSSTVNFQARPKEGELLPKQRKTLLSSQVTKSGRWET